MSDFQTQQQFQTAPPPVDIQYQSNPLDDPAMQAPPLAENSDICYCRNCGKMLPKNAVVCVGCDYVMNPAMFRDAQMSVRERQQTEESAMKIRRFLRVVTGAQATPVSRVQPSVQRNYKFQTEGPVYCTNCGHEVQDGASVCVHCQYVIDPAAVRRAKMLVEDRTATLDKKEFIRCLLIPGKGRKMYRANIQRRPQIAKPCRVAGIINSAAIALVILLLIIFG